MKNKQNSSSRGAVRRAARGETLMETLAAILLVTLASVLFLAAISSSTRATATADRVDSSFYAAQGALDAGGGTPQGDLTLALTCDENGAPRTLGTADVALFGQDQLLAYENK